MKTEQARPSGRPGKEGVFTLTPMPTMICMPAGPTVDSVRMPQSFLPEQRMSFGHLICVSRPQTAFSALATATAARGVTAVSRSSGAGNFSSME